MHPDDLRELADLARFPMQVIAPDGVERSMGKMRRIVDQRREH